MARFPEQRLWDRIRRNLGREIAIERIENSAKAGTPDTVVIHRSKVTFVEHKTGTMPARSTSKIAWRHKLTPQQRNWHREWHQNGGDSWIVCGIGKSLYAVPGRLVDEINNMTYEKIALWAVDMKLLANIYKNEFVQ
jgi:hypothetical protein